MRPPRRRTIAGTTALCGTAWPAASRPQPLSSLVNGRADTMLDGIAVIGRAAGIQACRAGAASSTVTSRTPRSGRPDDTSPTSASSARDLRLSASTTVRSRVTAAGRRSSNAETSAVPTPRPCQSSATVTAGRQWPDHRGAAADGRPRPGPPRPLAAAPRARAQRAPPRQRCRQAAGSWSHQVHRAPRGTGAGAIPSTGGGTRREASRHRWEAAARSAQACHPAKETPPAAPGRPTEPQAHRAVPSRTPSASPNNFLPRVSPSSEINHCSILLPADFGNVTYM